MSLAVYEKTKESINHAFETKDAELLEKETQFIINYLVSEIPETFSESVRFVGLRQTKFKDPQKFLTETHKNSMRQLLEVINNHNQTFSLVKLLFDKWYLETTEEGYIDYEYEMSELVSVETAAKMLGVTKPTAYKYLEKGLESKEINGVLRVPKAAIELWKDPSVAFELQWIYQQNIIRKQSLEDKFEMLQQKINEFEIDFGDTFENLYGNLTEKELDGLDEAIDVFDWKSYINQKGILLEKIKAERSLDAQHQ